jgi:hypothetical protein
MERLEITDVAIWFKHVHAKDLLSRLQALEPEDEILLSVDRVVGRWRRMKTGTDGRPVFAIRPVGPMKDVWNGWYKSRKGDRVDIEAVQLADDFLAATAGLMSEWSSAEDESAFSDL